MAEVFDLSRVYEDGNQRGEGLLPMVPNLRGKPITQALPHLTHDIPSGEAVRQLYIYAGCLSQMLQGAKTAYLYSHSRAIALS